MAQTRLTERETYILDALRDGMKASANDLSDGLYWNTTANRVPASTIRRIIGDLRRKGYNIVATLPNSRNNRYMLVSSPAQQTEGAADVATA